jgi:MHS family citrate/tricarballylate:H+ symporter-like MFS transporter
MMLSLTMMGSAIIALALTPSYEAIGIAAPILAIVARMVQGFSLGGEVGPTTAYLMEAAAADRRGFAVSWQPASQQIAATTGALVGLVLSELMTSEALDSYGWRTAFLIGAVTLPFGLWMRSGLPETLHIGETETAGSSLGTIRTNARVIILGLLILASGTIVPTSANT